MTRRSMMARIGALLAFGPFVVKAKADTLSQQVKVLTTGPIRVQYAPIYRVNSEMMTEVIKSGYVVFARSDAWLGDGRQFLPAIPEFFKRVSLVYTVDDKGNRIDWTTIDQEIDPRIA